MTVRTAARPDHQIQVQCSCLAAALPACARHSVGDGRRSGPALTGRATSDSITTAMTNLGRRSADDQMSANLATTGGADIRAGGKGASVILLFILVWGMFAGWIAHLLLARHQPINWAELLVVGLAGSFLGGLLSSLLSGDGLALRPSGIIGSILGAVVLLAAWQALRPTPRRRTR
jgi:uncharacterized membrane protein YeaQ/YmgE (transglycosylase-associated protein family)